MAERDRTLTQFRKGQIGEQEHDALLEQVAAQIIDIEREHGSVSATAAATERVTEQLAEGRADVTRTGYPAQLERDNDPAMREIIGKLVSQVMISYAEVDGRRRRQARVRLDRGEAFGDGAIGQPTLSPVWGRIHSAAASGASTSRMSTSPRRISNCSTRSTSNPARTRNASSLLHFTR